MPRHEIHTKVLINDIKAITDLIAADSTIINLVDDDHNTPVFLACHAGQVDIVNLLINKGAILSIPNAYSDTPLHRVMSIIASGGIIIDGEKKSTKFYYSIVEMILRKDVQFLAIRGQFSQYPIYALRNHKEEMDRVVSIIKGLGTVSQILPAFIADLQHRAPSVQESAVSTLSSICVTIPETSSQIIPALISTLQKMRPAAQKQAAHELGKICVKMPGTSSQIIPALISALQEMCPAAQQQAVQELVKIGVSRPETRENILRAFIQLLHNERNPYKLGEVIQVICSLVQARLVPNQEILQQIISTFTGYLNDKTSPYTVKIDSVGILGEVCKIDPEMTAPQIIPALIKLLDGDNVVVKQKVTDMLGNIGKFILPQKIFEIIGTIVQPLLSSEVDLSVKKHVVDTLVSICTAIPEITICITNTFKSSLENKAESEELKIYVINSLHKLCEEMAKVDVQKALEIGKQVQPIFAQALRDESLSLTTRRQAGQALAGICIAIPDLEAKKPVVKGDGERANTPTSSFSTSSFFAPKETDSSQKETDSAQEGQSLLVHRKGTSFGSDN